MIRAVTLTCSLGVFVGLLTAKAAWVGAQHLISPDRQENLDVQ